MLTMFLDISFFRFKDSLYSKRYTNDLGNTFTYVRLSLSSVDRTLGIYCDGRLPRLTWTFCPPTRPSARNRLLDSISSSPEDVHSDVMLAPGHLTVSCGARRLRAACGGPRRDLLHRLDPEPRAHGGGRVSDRWRPPTVLATKMLSRALALPVGDRSGRWCRLHPAPSSPASPDGGSCRAGCWAPLECATPRWSRIWARDHIFKRRRHRGAVRGPALQQVGP